jgi:hypothetical protein
MIWLFMLAGMLQAALIGERILHRVLGLFVGVPVGEVKRLAIANFFVALLGFLVQMCLMPLSLLFRVLVVLWGNALLTAALVAGTCVLAVLAETSGGLLATLINAYNSGVGVTFQNEYVQPLLWFDTLLGQFVRLWNVVLWVPGQMLSHVILPSIRYKPESFLVMSGNAGLFVSALAISAGTTVSRTSECMAWDPALAARAGRVGVNATANMSAPFMPDGLQCVGNKNYLELDMMTPSIYMRNVLQAASEVLVAGCSGGDLVIQLAMYPLLDYNAYKALHCLVNVLVQVVLVLPIATYQRCEYGKQPSNGFSLLEKRMMCVPDPTMTMLTLNAMLRALGRLVDNWGDFAIIVLEKVTGRPTVVCSGASSAQTLESLWREAGDVLSTPLAAVALSDSLMAATDGHSTLYTTTRSGQIVHAVGNWPFAVDTRAGVAAVRHSWALDADDDSSVHTGLLGCRCLDVVVDSVPQIRILCASVPYRGSTAFDEAQLNTSTVIETRFYPAGAPAFMRCATTRVRVSSLRFPRKRASKVLAGGIDVDFQDKLDALGGADKRSVYAADAAIYVQAQCASSTTGSGNGMAQCVGESSCFPFCMGLHLAGQNAQAITLYSAREWEQSVQVSQLDCAGMADLSTDPACEPTARSTSEAYGFSDSSCEAVCTPNDNARSSLSVGSLRVAANSSASAPTPLSMQKDAWVTVRMGSQPFVVAGDVMLFLDSSKADDATVVVTRLYDNNLGDYSVQNEQLTLASNRHGVPAKQCVTEDARINGEPCHLVHMRGGAIVIPSSNQLQYEASGDFEAGPPTYPATASQWGVHWIYNPDDTLVQASFRACREDTRQYEIVNRGGYAKPRIWTLKTMRLSSMGGPAQPWQSLTSYMVVPDWFDPEVTSCEQEVNLRVLGLEYIDPANVLVSVLRTTPANYDWRAGAAFDDALARVVFYYLHPNVHTCTEISESRTDLIFTCWRELSEGRFPRDDASESKVALGTICPAARRFPSFGIMAAELAVAAVETLRLGLDGVLTIPAALHTDGDLSGVFAPRMNLPTFHSMLDSSGTALLNPDAVLESLEKVAMYGVQVIIRIGEMVQKDGEEFIGTVVLGTARVVQHTGGVAALRGSLLSHWNALKDAPTSKVLEGVQANVPGMTKSSAMQTMARTVSSLTSTLRLNAKLLQRMILKVLRSRSARLQMRTFSALMTEASEDVRRGWLDVVRTQCHGLATLVGSTNPPALVLRESCLSVPDAMQGTLEVLNVLTVDYPGMSCACTMTEAREVATVIRDTCLQRELPVQQRVLLKQIARGALSEAANSPSDPANMCFLSMDAANYRLEHAFDPLFMRTEAVAKHLAESLDYLSSFWDSAAGDCSNTESPYVVTLVPEPVDYFLLCSDTATCRARCLDEFTAFEFARAMVDEPPDFVLPQRTQVQSRYFSTDDIENDRHLAPFEVLALEELADCSSICVGRRHPLDRCLAVAGKASRQEPAIAYYCVPADIFQYVAQYAGLPHPPSSPVYGLSLVDGDVLDGMYFLTTHLHTKTPPARETVLALVRNAEQGYSKLVMLQEGGLESTLLQTNEEELAAGMQSIEDVFVHPQVDDETGSHARVLVLGFSSSLNFVPVRSCLELQVPGWSLEPPFATANACTEHIEKSFLASHTQTCLDELCGAVLRLPLNSGPDSVVQVLESVGGELQTTSAPKAVASSVARVLGIDMSRSIYRTQLHQAAINTRHVASNTRSIVRAASGAIETVCVFVSGTLDSREAWIQNLCVEISGRGAVSLADAQTVTQSVDLKVPCELHRCAGCQGRPAQTRWEDLQTKCYMASACAVARCVGTTVNMRRPLCNLGPVAADAISQLNIIASTAWMAISHTVIGVVELSEMRRREFAILWPDAAFNAGVCHVKDQIMHTTAVLTSIFVGADAAVEDSHYDSLSSGVVDSRFHARRVMGTTAATSFLSSILLAPIFMSVAAKKTISCGINDTFISVNEVADLIASAAGTGSIHVTLGDKSKVYMTEAIAGKCLSQVMPENLGNLDTPQASANINIYIRNLLTDIGVRLTYIPIEPLIHTIDAVFSYAIGVVQGMQELVAAADWRHCKAPAAAVHDVSRCVCGDKPHRIPARVRGETPVHSAFWCSGPLLLTAVSGRSVLIWNPYSLEELLSLPGVDYDGFLACLEQGADRCDAKRPKSAFFEKQGVELMQVVTRCRANYQARTWDQGVVLLAVLSLEEWRSASPKALLDSDDGYAEFRRRWARLLGIMPQRPTLEGGLHACLRNALENSLWQHSCMRGFLLGRGHDSIESYFRYEPSGGGFRETDACMSFSGDVSQYSSENGVSHPPSLWSGLSDNRLPVAQYHHVLMGQEHNRAAAAEQELGELHIKIKEKLRSGASSSGIPLDIREISSEGDEVHQIVDCVMMGPYASANLQSVFETSGGQNFDVPQYHRGDPRTREFPSGRETGGSEPRRRIVNRILESLRGRLEEKTRTEAENVWRRMRTVMSDINNLRCQCQDEGQGQGRRSMECCQFSSRAEITFPAQDLLQREWDIAETVLTSSLQDSEIQRILDRVWTSQEFAPRTPREFSEAEKMELRDAYVFNYSGRVLHYSVDDVPQHSSSSPLWHECTALLSAAFFTIPLRAQGGLDVDLEYDPTTVSSARFLHGMEEVIERVVARSRADSPVFWSHVHRYVPSDSVWCEDTTAPPRPHAATPDIFGDGREWEGMVFGPEHVRGPDLDAVRFPGDLRCICNWTVTEGESVLCAVPSCTLLSAGAPVTPPSDWTLGDAWNGLCGRGRYTSRADLFLLLEVMQTYSIDTTETCVDLVPSTVWGLLDSRQQREWYDSQAVDATLDLQELATNGPAGLRLGLLGREGALLQFLAKNDILRPVRPGVNFRYQHTVAQPFCVKNLADALHADLSRHFTDVFFPMAHSVHEAPVTALCSRWVVEHAIAHALGLLAETNAEVTDADVAAQRTTAAAWERRCEIQVQQLGICVLRGVFDLKPEDWNDGAQGCPFAVTETHGCGLFYVTSNCLVMCDGDFFDPCSCDPEVATCDTAVFAGRASCGRGKLRDIRHWASEPTVQLYSMQWPERILPDEARDERQVLLELNEELGRVREALARQRIDVSSLFGEVREIVLAQNAAVREGEAPASFCEDLLDYMPDDAQHPVGYHPTCTCLRETTHMRGFSSWMSTLHGSEVAWSIDPVRLRNMTEYSRVFGAAHLVCDAVAYTAAETELNAYHLTSRWDPTEPADAAFPIRPTEHSSLLEDMFEFGSNERMSEREHPLVQGTPTRASFQHSVGLVRDWFGCYDGHLSDGQDCQELHWIAAWKASWPHADTTNSEYYGLSRGEGEDGEEEVSGCAEPPLATCLSDEDCQAVRSDLVCLQPEASSPPSPAPGVCEKRGRCYQHAHCAWPAMCSGEGECVQPRVYVRNQMASTVDVQLFARNRSSCPVDTYGMSQHQQVPGFAQTHGLCKFRNWFEYQQMLANGTNDGLLRRVNLERMLQRTDDTDSLTLSERGVLKMQPHPCDRSYQHTELGVCTNTNAWVSPSLGFMPEEPLGGRRTRMRSMRTWHRKEDSNSVLLCNLADGARTGFLNPYKHYGLGEEEEDTLRFVPQDVRLCREFEVCPVLKFWVDEKSVERRMIRTARAIEDFRIAEEEGFRAYRFQDSTQCGAVGAIVLDMDMDLAQSTCVVDRLVVPAADFLFTATLPDTPIVRSPPINPEYSELRQGLDEWGPGAMRQHFDRIRSHCASAFYYPGQDEDALFRRYMTYATKLTNTYSMNTAGEVATHASLLVLELFGLHEDSLSAGANRRGFYTIDQYNEKARCAEYVLEGLERVRAFHSSREPPYTIEKLWTPPVPGRSLYFFRGSSPIYVPFAWLWQCVVVATDTEGGAPRAWFSMLVDPGASEYPECRNFKDFKDFKDTSAPTASTDKETVKRKLQRSRDIFKLAETVNGVLFSDQLLDDINHVLVMGVDALHISVLADTFCLYTNVTSHSECPEKQAFFLHRDRDRCWTKSGRDLGNLIESGGSKPPWFNLLEETREVLLGGDFERQEMDLDTLRAANAIEVTEDVDYLLGTALNYIPRLTFPHARDWLAGNELDEASYDRLSTDDYAVETPPSNSFNCIERDGMHTWHLKQDEFKVRKVGELVPETIAYLTPHLATVLLLRYFTRNIYSTQFFRSGSMIPHALSSARMYSSLNESNWKAHLEEAKTYDDFMRSKKFECQDDRTYKPTLETNRHHRFLRACVSEMKEDSGWVVEGGYVLHVEVSADVLLEGFFPSFIESEKEPGFLDSLFSDEWASKVDTRNNICFQDRGLPRVMNPYWAGHYDYRTGCDVEAVGDYRQSLRRVDGACDETCAQRFPEFAATIRTDMPPACRDLYEQGTVFTAPAAWSTSLNDGEPLCQRQPAAATGACGVAHGTLLHSAGRDVPDLHAYEDGLLRAEGVWAEDNAVLRGRVDSGGGHTTVFRVLPTDIAGHMLWFDVSSRGKLELACMPLQSVLRGPCTVTAKQMSQRARESWAWQHTVLGRKWSSGSSSGKSSWKCPLKWLEAHSDGIWSFSAASPSALRNAVRFRHITGAHFYAHPTVRSSQKLQQLFAGRFLNETAVCTDAGSPETSTECRGASLLMGTLRSLREHGQWHQILYREGAQCADLLDWPHQSYRLADHTPEISIPATPCNIWGRLPRFAYRRTQRAHTPAPRSTRTAPWPQPSASHACRMGRLRRLQPTVSPVPVQYCSAGDGVLLCEAVTRENTKVERTRYNWTVLPDAPRPPSPAPSPAPSRRVHRERRCAACEDHSRYSFVNRNGQSSESSAPTDGRSTQLGTGRPVALSPARMVASFLRKAVCPRASAGPCAALDALMNSSSTDRSEFSSSNFLRRLLSLPLPPQTSGQVASDADSRLWARPWVFCDQTRESAGCNGAINKSAWLDSATRADQCIAAVMTSRTVRSSPLQFCKLSAVTENMCADLMQWRQAIEVIICRAAGLAECPLTGFFYSPTAFSIENGQFAHDSVSDFYAALGSTCLPSSAASAVAVQANAALLAQCASRALQPLKQAVQDGRLLASMLVELLYYGMQIGVQITKLLITVVTGAVQELPAIGRQLVKYIMLFLRKLGAIFVELADALWQVITDTGLAEKLKKLVFYMCEAINFLHRKIVAGVVCVVVRAVKQMVQVIMDIVNGIDFMNVLPKSAREFKMNMDMPSFCEENPLQCSSFLQEVQETVTASPLPTSTPCWSVYSTFFGDTSTLSCTPADSCATSLERAADPVLCGNCPEASSSVRRFACSPVTKKCTCGVPVVTESRCLSNEECQESTAKCRYINSAFEHAAGSIACESCLSRRFCFVGAGEATGYCACALLDADFAECPASELGQKVMPAFDKLCLLTHSVAAATSMVYSIRFEEALSTPCSSLFAYTTLCVYVAGQGEFVVGYAARQGRRLLLEGEPSHESAHEGESPLSTRSPICSDALGSNQMPAVRRACLRAHAESVLTLRELNLSTSLAPCAFCSMEDFQETLKTHPGELMRVALHPAHTVLVLLRHSPLRHGVLILRSLRESVQALALDVAHMVQLYHDDANASGVPPLLRRILRALQRQSPNHTWTHSAHHHHHHHHHANASSFSNTSTRNSSAARRSLLGTGVLGTIDDAFTGLMNTHESYSSRVNTGWKYDYPDLVQTTDGRTPWVVDTWPPFMPSGQPRETATCSTLGALVKIVDSSVGTTVRSLTQKVVPPRYALPTSWFTLRDAGYVSGNITLNKEDDWVVRHAVWASKHALAFLGVRPDTIYNLLFSVIEEARSAIRCDFEAVQTCSRWKVRILPGILIVGVIVTAVVGVLFAAGLPLFAVFCTVLYVPLLLYFCYGHSPACTLSGLLPACLLQDVVQTLQALLPNFILLPQSMLQPGCSMDEDSLFLRDACIVHCHEQPFEFGDWYSVLAWCVAELGETAVGWMDDALANVPLIDREAVRGQLWTKNGVYQYGGESLVTGHRICAFISSYKLLPYLLIVLMCVVLTFVILGLLLDLVFSLFVLLSTLVVTLLF